MSSCVISGIAAAALFAASFSTMTVSDTQQVALQKALSPELVQKYQNIVAERRNIYLFGLVLGATISYFVLRRVTLGTFHRVTAYTAITLLTAVLFYFLAPKSDYMLRHLQTKEENIAWLNVYNTMKYRYFIGFVLGGLAAVPLSLSFC
jgi:hypothetical protein